MEEIRRQLPTIDYIYEETPADLEESIPRVDFRAAVTVLPSVFLDELRGLIEEGDIYKFEETMEKRLKSQEPELAAHLKHLADMYDYDGILDLLIRSGSHE